MYVSKRAAYSEPRSILRLDLGGFVYNITCSIFKDKHDTALLKKKRFAWHHKQTHTVTEDLLVYVKGASPLKDFRGSD